MAVEVITGQKADVGIIEVSPIVPLESRFLPETWVYATPLPYEWKLLPEDGVIPLAEILEGGFQSLEIAVDFISGPEVTTEFGYCEKLILWPDGIVRSGTGFQTGPISPPGTRVTTGVRVGATVEPAGVCVPGKYIATFQMYTTHPSLPGSIFLAEAFRTFYIE